METHQGRSALYVLVERKSRLVKIQKLAAQTSPAVSRTVTAALKRLPRGMRRSLTYDNGSENVGHREINRRLGTSWYFCVSYHSWEKGAVGTIRQIERRMNTRPRKRLHFAIPLEVFHRGVALTR